MTDKMETNGKQMVSDEKQMETDGNTSKKKLSLIVFSGDFDRLTAAFTLATGAAAVGYEVNMFFTFWGLDAIKQKRGRALVGSGFMAKVFGWMMGGLSVAPTSRFNFLGLGPGCSAA